MTPLARWHGVPRYGYARCGRCGQSTLRGVWAAQHGRKESIKQLDVLREAAKKADLDPAIVDAALADESTINDVLADHEEAVRRYRAFGVPTIAIEGLDVGFYGPIIQFVPRGEEAGEMWDHMAWALRQPNLFELKRDRGAVKWEPIAE